MQEIRGGIGLAWDCQVGGYISGCLEEANQQTKTNDTNILYTTKTTALRRPVLLLLPPTPTLTFAPAASWYYNPHKY